MSSFSPFHLHRIVRAFLNEPIGMYITRQRVKKAALLIRNTKLSIQDIAYKVGYDMPSSLSKAFKKLYNITPTEYRTNKNIEIMNRNIQNEDYNLQEPQIVERPDSKVVYIQIQIYNAIFSKWLPESQYQLRELPSFESYLSDPFKVKPEDLETLLYIPIE
ncbi:MAG: helix-turn-helix domain-containing protein [Bacteroidales bacterium]